MEGVLTTHESHGTGDSMRAAADWTAFMDRLVHDLREPLRSINVFAELLQDSSNSKRELESRQFLAEIRSGAGRMQTLLEGLGAYSMALHEAPVGATSLQSALKIVVANMDEKIRASEATVSGSDLPRVTLSLERAMQVFEQLIENSLRFRSEAAPVIRISAEEEPGGMWAIHVEDNGIGVPPEHHEDVFKPFVRLEGRKYPGAGLGLTICRTIVEAHGGTIRMESAPAQGCICTFTLPEA
jgi:light-regulated signal transduction histidine kinase (bacteriophytochrome)